MLQDYINEEGKNKYGPDIWINILDNWIKLYSSQGVERFIITDVRFLNEVKYIKKLGGIIFRIIVPRFIFATCREKSQK